MQNLLGGDKAMAMSRTPEIVADAARVILERDPREATGNAYIDDEVLAAAGVTDLERYRAADGDLALDLFVDGWPVPGLITGHEFRARHLGRGCRDDDLAHGSTPTPWR